MSLCTNDQRGKFGEQLNLGLQITLEFLLLKRINSMNYILNLKMITIFLSLRLTEIN